MTNSTGPWYRELTRYHWFVLIVAALGWLFDTMDQQLFTLARVPAMRELLAKTAEQDVDRTAQEAHASPSGDELQKLRAQRLKELVDYYGPLATAIFLIGWASGGIAFGVMGDRAGRARTMIWTILVYSMFTGLSALSVGFWDFALYRFLTGLGVGGEFAVGVALVAEVMPDRARPYALGLLQALSAVGNIAAAVIGIALGYMEGSGALAKLTGDASIKSWRVMFVVGILPALLAILIRRRLKEPERWQAAVGSGAARYKAGSYAELFGDRRWRGRAMVGMLLAFAGVVGLWGIGFFSPDLLDAVFRKRFVQQGLKEADVTASLSYWKGVALILQNLGGFFGIWAYSRLAPRFGRKAPLAVFFVLAMLSTALVFGMLDEFSEIFWMIPLMGFCQLALFGGYAIYFPELFPTRLRSTGTSFCYNVGRFVAAIGPFTFGYLTSGVFKSTGAPLRYAGVSMCAVFLVGLVALPFAPETKGQPLPE